MRKNCVTQIPTGEHDLCCADHVNTMSGMILPCLADLDREVRIDHLYVVSKNCVGHRLGYVRGIPNLSASKTIAVCFCVVCDASLDTPEASVAGNCLWRGCGCRADSRKEVPLPATVPTECCCGVPVKLTTCSRKLLVHAVHETKRTSPKNWLTVLIVQRQRHELPCRSPVCCLIG